MKTLGIVGGIAPGSTIDYYRLLVDGYRDRTADGSYPPIVINSIDMQAMLAFAGRGDRPGLAAFLADKVAPLARAGAEIALLASNTPHLVFAEVAQQSRIPLISIVEETAAEVKRRGCKTVGLVGTRFTMRGGFYHEVFAREGMRVVLPTADDQVFIHEKYMGELVKGVFLPQTRDRLLAIARELQREQGIEALILGGTELPLLLRDAGDAKIPFIDTTRVHVQAALNAMLS